MDMSVHDTGAHRTTGRPFARPSLAILAMRAGADVMGRLKQAFVGKPAQSPPSHASVASRWPRSIADVRSAAARSSLPTLRFEDHA